MMVWTKNPQAKRLKTDETDSDHCQNEG